MTLNKGKFNSILLLSTIFIILLSTNLFSKTKLDIKTTMEEKQELRIIKLALINTLQQTEWAELVEIGEDYSFWITDLNRVFEGDSVISSVSIELRTPAMFLRGQRIISNQVFVKFDTSSISDIKSSEDSLFNAVVLLGLEQSGLLSDLVAIFSLESFLLNEMIIKPLIKSVVSEIMRPPTPFEALESILLSARIYEEIKSYIADEVKQK